MDVTIIGTGRMADAIATRLVSGRNNVTIHGRDKKEADNMVKELNRAANGASAKSAELGSSITGDVVVLAVPYSAASTVVRDYGNKLDGKIIIDISNPFNTSRDDLVTPPDSSAAEEIAKSLPHGARLVKAFNTCFDNTVKRGQTGGFPLDIYIAGDDENAKRTVAQLIEAGNMRPIDVGPLKRARYLEGMTLINMSLQSKLGTNRTSTFKIVSDIDTRSGV